MTAAPQQQNQTRRAQPASSPSHVALALRTEANALVGGTADPLDATKRLREALEKMNLISPSTSVGTLPPGCEVAFSTVLVDLSETYSTGGGKLGLGKVALDRIAAAAGISWDSHRSGRTDDGSDPSYCAWRAVGVIRNFDGSEREIVGNKEMDLREGSSTVAALYERYRAARANPRQGKAPPKDPTAQINEMRLHIMAHAETKARLRAIRSIGLEAGYSEADLAKPFVVAKLGWTGRVPGNPELERDFALKTADMMLGATRMLYGSRAEPIVATQRTRLAAPPPVGSVPADDDVIDAEVVATTNRAPAQAKTAPPTGPAQQSRAEERPAQTDAREPSGFLIPGGNERGSPIETASDESLRWWHDRISENLASGRVKPRFEAQDRDLVAALAAEMAWRAGDLEEEDDPFSADDDERFGPLPEFL